MKWQGCWVLPDLCGRGWHEEDQRQKITFWIGGLQRTMADSPTWKGLVRCRTSSWDGTSGFDGVAVTRLKADCSDYLCMSVVNSVLFSIENDGASGDFGVSTWWLCHPGDRGNRLAIMNLWRIRSLVYSSGVCASRYVFSVCWCLIQSTFVASCFCSFGWLSCVVARPFEVLLFRCIIQSGFFYF